MFKKPFSIKSQSRLRSSDVRRFRAEVEQAFGLQESVTGQGDDRAHGLLDRICGTKHTNVTICKIATHGGRLAVVYKVDGTPVFFRLDEDGGESSPLVPTVYSLWAAASAGVRLVPLFETPPEVLPRLLDGADLMLPGAFLPRRGGGGVTTMETFVRGQPMGVCALRTPVPFAVGLASVSAAEFADDATERRGKALRTLHAYGDQLWSAGDRSEPPTLDGVDVAAPSNLAAASMRPDTADSESTFAKSNDWTILDAEAESEVFSLPDSSNVSLEDELDDDAVQSIDGRDLDSLKDSFVGANGNIPDDRGGDSHVLADAINKLSMQSGDNSNNHGNVALASHDTNRDNGNHGCQADAAPVMAATVAVSPPPTLPTDNEISAPDVASQPESHDLPIEECDRILESAFLTAICTHIKQDPKLLPITSSALYSSHILPCRQLGTSIDIKKTSFKKVSKFYKSLEKRGIIKCKEQAGELRIVSVNFMHPSVVEFEPPRKLAGNARPASTATLDPASTNPDDAGSDASYQHMRPLGKLDVTELFKMPKTDSIKTFFAEAARDAPSGDNPYSGDGFMTPNDVRVAIKKYVDCNGLVVPTNQRSVRLDPVLRNLLLTRDEISADNVDTLRRDELYERLTLKLLPHHRITYVGSGGSTSNVTDNLLDVHKGPIVPVTVLTRRRGGRPVTVIQGIHRYVEDMDALIHELRHKLACSISVENSTAAGRGRNTVDIIAQGTKAYEVCQVLDRILGIGVPAGLKPVRAGQGTPKNFVTKLLHVTAHQ